MLSFNLNLILLPVLLGTALSNSLAAPQPATIVDTDAAAALEAAIASIPGATRLSKLPPDTIYPFSQHFLNETSGEMANVTTHTTVGELLGNSVNNIHKRAERFGPVCETTTGSPDAMDIIKALAAVDFSQRKLCCQYQPFRSKCHEMQRINTAAIGICGDFMRCVPCEDYVNMMIILVDRCHFRFPGKGLLAGGKFVLGETFAGPPWGGFIVAFHT